MDSKQFFYLTAEVRRLQKEYFKTRSSQALQASKAKEAELDKEIARTIAIKGYE